jgi:multiple sugar transport system permease protein
MTDIRATTQQGAPAVAGERGERRRVNPITVVIYTLLVVLALIYIYPFLVQLATSFKTDAQAASEPASLRPDPATTAAFEELFTRSDFPLWTLNSVIVTLFVTRWASLFDSLAGYALARLRFGGRGAVFAAVVAVMAVPSVVLLIPKFLVVNQLGIYRSVVLPMARPALITLVILSFQGSWNELIHFIVSRSDPDLNTLTTGVAALAAGSLGQGTQYPLKLAAALIMTIPVALPFFVFQRYIMASAEGGVKE